jgi:Uncharacterized conserved protein (DUF2303)
MEDTNNNAASVIDVVERLSEPQLVTAARGTEQLANLLVVPNGKQVVSLKPLLDQYLPRPERKEGCATLTTLDAFNAYVDRHKTLSSAVFVDDTNAKAPRIVAIFDANDTEADWQRHRAVYAFPLSDEWKKWSNPPESFSQADFANFLEDRITDVIDPSTAGAVARKFAEDVGAQLASPAKLLELSRGLAVNVDARAVSKVNLGNGTGEISYKEEHNDSAGEPIKVPGAFVIGIPVFRLGAAYSIPVRLRYRMSSGKILWSLALQRIDHVFEDAIADAATKVSESTGLPVFRGKPD